jgi:hypothetical protein
MKNFKGLTLTGLGLLFVLIASRVSTGGNPASRGPDPIAHAAMDRDGVASERSRELQAPPTRIGGIWFW